MKARTLGMSAMIRPAFLVNYTTTSLGVMALAGAIASSSSAWGQPFNIDANSTVAATPGMGVPSAAFGGAAAQPGVWNDLAGTTLSGIPTLALVDISGAATPVTLTRTTTGATFGFNNTNMTGDHALLINDYHDVGTAGATTTYTFNNLTNGLYEVYTYAVAPDSAAYVSSVTINGMSQNVGGTLPVNSFTQGVTHAKHSVNVTGGTLAVTIATVASFGTVNGLQLKPVTFSASGAANPSAVAAGGSTLLTVTLTGAVPPGAAVTGNLSAIGGSASQMFFDNGTNGDVTAGDNIFSYQATVAPGTPDAVYALPFTVTGGSGASGSISLQVGYCTASSSNCTGFERIVRFQLNTIDNMTGSTGGACHVNHTNLSTTLTPGQGYMVTLTNGDAAPSTSAQASVWVDWNNDGTFGDVGSGEQINLSQAGQTGVFTGTLTVPNGVSAGAKRLRARIIFTGTISPCGNADYGEIEDYTVNVSGPMVTCPADIAPQPNGNGTVNIDDLFAVINAWGACPAPPANCPADIAPQPNGNGTVNIDDLFAVINAWGPCPPPDGK